MQFEKINNKGQAQLFNSKPLESLTKCNPWAIFILYLPIIAFLPIYTFIYEFFSAGRVVTLFVAGIFFWTFTEYILHRFAFHHDAISSWVRKLIYLFHGNHHEYPRDKERLLMPVVPSLLISSLFLFVFYLLMGKDALAFYPGFMLGYLIYGLMHYAIHAWNPPFKWMKPLWRNHHLHHYKHTDKGFGVSSTFWDIVFGTAYDLKKESVDKEKIKDLTY